MLATCPRSDSVVRLVQRRWRELICCVVLSTVAGCQGAEAGKTPGAGSAKARQTPEATAIRVETAVIQPSAARLQLTLPGEVEGWRDALLAAPMGGYVERVSVSAGDKVRRGQTLVAVDTATHAARRAQAKVELDSAKRELRRAKALGDALPRAQLDAADSRYKAARAAIRTADVQVARSIVRAPFSGTIVDVDIEMGEVAAPGRPLVRLVKLNPAKIVVSLSDRDVLAIKEGMVARVTTEARGGVFVGKVKHIHRAADINTRTFMADIEVPNKEHKLLPGMITSVKLDASVAEKQVVISQDWLVTRRDKIGVFVNDGGVAKWTTVGLGPVARSQVIVTQGLKSGEELVITGHRELAQGDKLLIARKGVCCVDGRVKFE